MLPFSRILPSLIISSLTYCILLPLNCAKAQVIPDNTLGTQNSIVTPNQIIKEIPTDRIDGGAIRGANLFHSFREFNIGEGRGVYFTNPSGIENILTRVTGNNLSNILGTLGVNGGANLFLLNPNGIIFGENARLDINGSFVGTTANGIGFENQGFFSATNPQIPSQLLTIKPDAFFFNQLQPGKIESSSVAPLEDNFFGLKVPDGRSLLLVGGEIAIDGGELNANGGRVELAGLAGNGTVGLNFNANDLSLTVPDDIARADVLLNNAAFIDVSAGGGGSIAVNARNLTLRDESFIFAGISSGLGTPDAQAGDIIINASDNVLFDNSSASNLVLPGTIGNAGDISITSGSLEVLNGAELNASTFGEGDAGSVNIIARDLVKFDDQGKDVSDDSGAFSFVQSGAIGEAGGVSITTGSLEVTNGAELNASTFGEGDAGSVNIIARDLVKFDGQGKDVSDDSGAFSFVQSGAIGEAGGVSITTGSLEVTNGAELNASTFGEGDAGSVNIIARDLVKFDGQGKDVSDDSGAFSFVQSGAIGEAGGVSITTGSLEVTNGAELNASTFGEGDAGSVNIIARDLVKFDGQGKDVSDDSGAFSFVQSGAIGEAGGVSITTGSLEVTNGAELNASTFGEGDAGSVNIIARDLVKFDGQGKNISDDSGAFSFVQSGAIGEAGGVSITTGSLEVTNGAELNASTFGEGDAGSVNIIARDLVKFDGQGKNISDDSGAFSIVGSGVMGKAGGISINTGSLEVTNGAELNASTFGEGDAGSVNIIARDLVKFDGQGKNISDDSGAFSIVGSGVMGKAGGISINTGSLEVTNGAELNASTFGEGDAGSVNIIARDLVKFDGQGKNISDDSGAFSIVQSGAIGEAGGVSITTGSLEVTNGAELNASTFGEGNAGSVEISANTLEVSNRGSLSSSTSSQFPAGNIILKVKDNIIVSGSDTGIFVTTDESSTGKGGSIIIDPTTMTIEDGATISANSQGKGTGGDIQLTAGLLTLDNGTISAETRSNTGGNIQLNLQDLLLLRNGSQISTTAGNQEFGGNGGNIAIDTPFIVALPQENSDITANAFLGDGGNIDILTQGLFGIAFQEQPRDGRSDITASSEFGISGNVNISPLEVDPAKGLVELPVDVTDAANQISNACTPGGSQFDNEFLITGRGGLPMNPTQPLQETNTLSTWVKLKPQSANSANLRIKPPSKTVSNSNNNKVRKIKQIVEATGWIVDKDGNIEFVADANRVNPRNNGQTPVACKVSG